MFGWIIHHAERYVHQKSLQRACAGTRKEPLLLELCVICGSGDECADVFCAVFCIC